MTRLGVGIGRYIVAAAAAWWLVSGGPARGQDNDFWAAANSGTWQVGSRWADGSTPSTLDRANFNLAGAYLVLFNGDPSAIRELNMTAGNVTFASSSVGAGHTLNVTSSTFGGPRNVNITNGASLSLGDISGFFSRPLHLTVGNFLSVGNGTLNVRFGSDVITSVLSSSGQINVTGLGSALTAGSTELSGGSLNVTAGGIVQTTNAEIRSVSMGTVSGAGSQWIDTGTIRVGPSTEGALNITDGGKVQSVFGVVGQNSTGVGVVTVSGADSQWNSSADLTVGSEGSGTLNVTGGGSVSSSNGKIGRNPGSVGAATITGGAWTMTERLFVGGDLSVPGGSGTLNIQPAGTVSAAQGVVLFPDGHMNLQGGTLDASSISYHQGIQGDQFQWTSGTLHVGTFNGSLTNSGGALAPGHSAGSTTINGNYTQVDQGVLEIEIGGPLAGSGFDFVNVAQSAQVNGELDLTLKGGFVPTPSQTFAILISNDLSGAFDNAPSGQRVTTSDGSGSFLVNYGFGSPFDDNQVVLSNFLAGFPADFDEDTDVDGADLARWRLGFGTASGAAHTQGDANGDGDADGRDFLVWQQQRGSGSLTAAAPEPTSAVIAFAAVFIMRGVRRRMAR